MIQNNLEIDIKYYFINIFNAFTDQISSITCPSCQYR